MTENKPNGISFHVNGKLQKIVNEYPIATNLATYLREVLQLTGYFEGRCFLKRTKTYCNEGGCGACAVHGRKLDPTTNEYIDVSINSCLFPLYSSDGWQFTTVEGIGNKHSGLHPIQKRLADAHGSQCGYCSPGFVMNMYNLLKNNPRPSKLQIEKSLDGNICRCTGYRAILDSMKSFADDPIDIEDLNRIKCLNEPSAGCGHHSQQQHSGCINHVKNGGKEWYQPSSLDYLSQLVTHLSASENQAKKYKFIGANTARGIYKTSNDPFDIFINLQNVVELNRVEISECIQVGASVTIKKLIDLFREQASSSQERFSHLSKAADHLELVAGTHIRNMASWSGNLSLKKLQPEFASDVLIALESANAKIVLLNLIDNTNSEEMSLEDYLAIQQDTTTTIIHSLKLYPIDNDKSFIKTFKVMKRPQNCHAYISASFRIYFDDANNKTDGLTSSTQKPSISFTGINEKMFHAHQTESYLMNKDLSNETVLTEAIKTLSRELSDSISDENNNKAINKALATSNEYLLNLAVSLFYKFLLSYLSENVKSFVISDAIKSAAESIMDCRREKESITEHKYQQNQNYFPVTKAIPKLNAYSQTAGETKYVNDSVRAKNELQGAFILSTVANARIDQINLEKALAAEGVVKILLAKDIPGNNSFTISPSAPEILFADKEVQYAGQALGLVLAETYDQAFIAAKLVEVTYKDTKKPILTIKDAIEQNSFHLKAKEEGDIVVGDAFQALKNAKHQVSGEVEMDGSQYHFYMEGVCCTCERTEDGFKVEVTTQWMDAVHQAIINVLDLKNASTVDIQVKQIGGGFGGKTSPSALVGASCALAVYHTNRPVRINLDLNTTMTLVGKRTTWFAKYNIGFDDEGRLESAIYDWFIDTGSSRNGTLLDEMIFFVDVAYKCQNYAIRTNLVKTNKPANLLLRCPDNLNVNSVTETAIEHVATYLKKDPIQIRQLNFYKKGDTSVGGLQLDYFHLDETIDDFIRKTMYAERKAEIDEYNRVNKWKKRGISLMPLRYNVTHNLSLYNALVSINHNDGSVAISHGGIEMGQGIHTKVAQVCAYQLGIPLEKISVKSTNTLVNPNALFTGASITTEMCSKAITGSCQKLLATLEPIRKMMPSENYTWEELIRKAYEQKCQLSEMYLQGPVDKVFKFTYDIYGCSCIEVLIDVLTGELEVAKAELLYDCGQSLNGMIDLGQAEGGFLMGLGFWLLEKTIHDPETGICLTNGTWEYKPPLAINLPTDFKMSFLQDKPNPAGFLGSKAAGEPPLILSSSIIFALRHALSSIDKNKDVFFPIEIPATPENVHLACHVDINELTFN